MIFVISGEVGSGKTTFFRDVVDRLRSRGVKVEGFRSERVLQGASSPNTRGMSGSEERHLDAPRSGGGTRLQGGGNRRDWCHGVGGRRVPFEAAHHRSPRNREQILQEGECGGYDIVEIGSEASTPWLRRGDDDGDVGPFTIVPEGFSAALRIIAGTGTSALLAVDELGPLELAGRGFWPALKPRLASPGRAFLFVIRTSCLTGFRALLTDGDIRVFNPGGTTAAGAAAEEIAFHARQG